jgi:ABC-type polysaccharide/polyol phosphate export permease
MEITIYSARSLYEKGLLKIFVSMIRDFTGNFELIYRLFWRNFVIRYKQSLLSWGWIFFMPFITMSTFLALNVSGVLMIGDLKVPYPIFGLLSVSLWNIFSNGLPNATTSLTSMGDLIGKINFPKTVLVFASMGQAIIDLFIRLGLVLIIYAIYGKFPNVYFLLLPFLLFPLVLLTLGFGFITSILQVIFKDTINFINLFLSLFLFLIPIMYMFPSKSFLSELNKFNPIYYLLIVPRDMVIFGKVNDLFGFAISSLFAVFVFFISWFVFYLSETKLAERI